MKRSIKMTRFKKFSKNCKYLQIFRGYDSSTKVCYSWDDRLYKDKCNKKNCPLLERKVKKGNIEIGIDGKCYICGDLTKDHDNSRYLCPHCSSR